MLRIFSNVIGASALVAIAATGIPSGASAQNGGRPSDADGDGIVDAADLCPTAVEDLDGFEDRDGCPDMDNDQDGIIDLDDQCPSEPENLDGFEDEDGCPEVRPATPYTWDDCYTIVIPTNVRFPTGSSAIPEDSFALLDELAEALVNSDRILQTRVDGHTDDQEGDDAADLLLSTQRALNVFTYLTETGGVDSDRLAYEAWGDTMPVADPTTTAGRELNRRVEFIILEQLDPCD